MRLPCPVLPSLHPHTTAPGNASRHKSRNRTASIWISGNMCVWAEAVKRRRVDVWGTRSSYHERGLSHLLRDKWGVGWGELTAEIRGRSQVKKEIKARRTLASCVVRQEAVKAHAKLCTSSPTNLAHAPMSNAKDDSINSEWASNSSRRPSNASMSHQHHVEKQGNVWTCLSLHCCYGASDVSPDP